MFSLKGGKKRENATSHEGCNYADVQDPAYSRFDEGGGRGGGDSSPQEVARLWLELRVLNIPPPPSALSLFIGASLITPSFYDVQGKAYFLTVRNYSHCQSYTGTRDFAALSLSLSLFCVSCRTIY